MPTHLKPIGHKFGSPCLCTNVNMKQDHPIYDIGTLLETVKNTYNYTAQQRETKVVDY